MPNWQAPGKDCVQGYCLKNITSLRPRIAVQLNHILDGERPLPGWMTLGKTVLSQKVPAKGSAVDNFRPVHLPALDVEINDWKIG